MANGWRSGGERVATYLRTHVPTNPQVRRAAARRAPRKTREELRETWGASARRIVAAYTDRRALTGFPPADRKGLGALAGQAMRLLDGGGWDEPTLLTAAISFADTKRFPGYFEEWASEILTRADLQAHKARRAEENISLPPEVLAAMGRA